ncbi:hypothetical protein QQ045_013362 [Rhodiola kirilowii]
MEQSQENGSRAYPWLFKGDLLEAIRGFFMGLSMPKNMTSTYLTLLPKVPVVTSISQLRPISLCNFCHKIISRILNTRLGKVLPNLISEEQAGFIHGRNIHENISLAHELTQELNVKSRGGNVIIKLDMAKAYDRISWSFIMCILRHLGFNEGWCDLVFRFISNCWYTVLWDSHSYGFFKSTQGVRQGDPLSPSLFIIAMEWISRHLNNAVRQRHTLPYSAKCPSIQINHLLYADDLLIFSNGSINSMRNLHHLILEFCSISGQALNPQKSTIFFSKNIQYDRKADLLILTGFSEGVFPISYLGAPLFRGGARIDFFDYLVDKAQRKIAGWSRNFISMAGRVVLVNAVLSSISMHVVACLPVPKTTLSRIQSIMTNFIWDSGGSKMRHWLSWDKLCRDKGAGVLGVRSLTDVQLAFRGKLAWNFLYSDSLWAKFMRGKYHVGNKGSSFWNSFNHLIPTIEAQCKWSLGKWTISADTWCKALSISVPSSIGNSPMHRILSDDHLKIILKTHMPSLLANHLDDIVLSRAPDRLIWMGSPTGMFSIKAFQNTYRTMAPPIHWTKFIWASWMPPKVVMFFWRLAMHAVSTDERIIKLRIPLASKCVCCNKHIESDRHLFFQGPWASELSSLLSDYFGIHRPTSLAEFLRSIPRTKCKDFRSCFYLGLFCCGLWEIWISRNKFRHNERHVPLRVSLRRWAVNLNHSIPYPNVSVPGISSLNINLSRKSGSWRLWKPGWNGVTLNIDIQVNESSVHGGAILRSNRGAFIGAFGMSFERSFSFRELIFFAKEAFIHLRVSRWSVCHVQSTHPLSHLLDPSHEPQRPWDSTFSYRHLLSHTNGLTACRICPGRNNPALVLASSPVVGSIFSKSQLPCGVRCALSSDSLGHACPGEDLCCPNHISISTSDDFVRRIPTRSNLLY